MDDAEEFYDGLASEYHLLFDDWWSAAQWHGQVVASLLADRGIGQHDRVLDCTCGIGTQALPLAALGYDVTGTDLSPRAVERARAEARVRGLSVELAVADLRNLRDIVRGSFDAVISFDNAVAHLLTDHDLDRAIDNIAQSLRPQGVFLASLRDYDAVALSRSTGSPITLHGPSGARHGVGQAWTWSAEGDYVDATLFTLAESSAGAWTAAAHETRLRALPRSKLTDILVDHGFAAVQWLMPADSGYYQPIVAARARG